MRVLHVLDSLNRGGAEMQALDICRNARRFGLDLSVAAFAGGALETDFRESGTNFFRLSRKLPLDIYLASQLRKIIREQKIAIVHGHQAVDGLHLYIATRGLRSVKKILSFHGFVADRRNRVASRFLIPRMDANIVVSRGLQNWLADRDRLNTRTNFHVIPTGADPLRLRPTGKSLRAELGLSEAAKVVGMIAGFYRDPRKDQLTVCRALPPVLARQPDMHCVFAGGIEDGAEDKFADCINFCIENNIADRVHFLGARADIADVLAALDIFILSSLQEGMPVAVSEAMLAGVPAVLSDIEPLREISGNGMYAATFPVGDASALADRLIAMLGDENARRRLADTARSHAVANFSIDAHLSALAALYRTLNVQ